MQQQLCDTPAGEYISCRYVLTVKRRAIVISCVLPIVSHIGDAAPCGSCRLDVVQICVAQSGEERRVVLQRMLIKLVYTKHCISEVVCHGGFRV